MSYLYILHAEKIQVRSGYKTSVDSMGLVLPSLILSSWLEEITRDRVQSKQLFENGETCHDFEENRYRTV